MKTRRIVKQSGCWRGSGECKELVGGSGKCRTVVDGSGERVGKKEVEAEKEVKNSRSWRVKVEVQESGKVESSETKRVEVESTGRW